MRHEERIRRLLTVNGFEIEAEFRRRDVEEIFLPLLRRLTGLWETGGRKRLIVSLAAPPGAGKTTLCAFLEELSREGEDLQPIQTVGLDGFHLPAAYLRSHSVVIGGKRIPMTEVKGSPETYDLAGLEEKLAALRAGGAVKWPVYSRVLHDVIPDAAEVMGEIVLLEGNWLLLDEPGWRELPRTAGYSVFLLAGEPMLRERLVERKARGGFSREEAEAFYEASDGVNVRRTLSRRLPADLTLELLEDGVYRVRS